MQQNLTNQDEIFSRVPPEIWVKLFELIGPNHSTLRLVCSRWKTVIDANFERKVKIDDDFLDAICVCKFRRVVDCTVYKFLRDDVVRRRPTKLFWKPDHLSSLNLCGPISKQNFMLIAKQCHCLKELYLAGTLLIGDSNLFDVTSANGIHILSRFMYGLHKLVINGWELSPSENQPTPINLYELLGWRMPELKTLIIKVNQVNFLVGVSSTNLFVLLEKFQSLERLDFTLRSVHAPIHDIPNGFVLPNLYSLNVEVKVPGRLPVWIKFVRAQSSIKHLKLAATHGEFYLDSGVVNAILNNAENLQSLELRSLMKVDNRLVVQLFTGLTNLKKLILQGYCYDNLQNLERLPKCLEVLVLENFTCKWQEIVSLTRVNVTTKNVYFE